MTLPKDHWEVYAKIESVSQGFKYLDHPATFVYFGEDGYKVTPENLLIAITDYPNHVVLHGNPLHQNLDFLRFILVDLVNQGHAVTVEDTADERLLPWRLVEPGVNFVLHAKDYVYNAKSYRRLRECDTIWFTVEDRSDYEKARAEILANRHWVKNQFKMLCMPYYECYHDLPYWIIQDQLEVSILSELF